MDCFAGKYLVEEIFKRDDVELAFVWNRTSSVLNGNVDQKYILEDLKDFKGRLAYLAILTTAIISLASFLWDVVNQYPDSDAASYQSPLFAYRMFHEIWKE